MTDLSIMNRCVLGLCLTMVWAGHGQAQVFGRNTASARFIEPPRAVGQELRDAQESIQEKQYSDAVVRLGDMLQREPEDSFDSDLAGQDFFLIEDAQRSAQHQTESVLRKARTMVGELPIAALDTYELQYGPLARRTLDEASAARNWERLRDVRRKFFHTKAGYEASLLLAQREFLTGHPLSASLLLDDVVKSARATDHLGQSVKLLHAAAYRLAGREDTDHVVYGQGDVVINGKSESWPDTEEVDQWIQDHYVASYAQAGGEIKDYSMFGAKPDRNGGVSGQMPLTSERWMLEITANSTEERALTEISNRLLTSRKLPPPSWTPLRVGNTLLMRTTSHLYGVDYRTGKRVWKYPWDSTGREPDEDEEPIPAIGRATTGDDGSNNLLTQRVWNDLPYGQVTSDGDRAYMIKDLSQVEYASFSPIMGMRGRRPSDTRTNTLVALDLASEGKLRWMIGRSSDQVSGLSDAFFLGPPLPLDGRLYVMAEMAGDILLVCLDPASGNELWRQQLVAVESGSVNYDAIRRVAGASPTYHEGVLVCPTGAGATVAVDLADRVLRWGVRYPRKTDASVNIKSGTGFDPTQLLQRWHSGVAIAADKSVWVTPIESDRLFCFDLISGSELFDSKSRDGMRYLAGVRDGKYYVVGSRDIRAFEATTAKEVWRTGSDFLAAGQQIVGRGVFGEGVFYVPTTSNQLIQISLVDGSVKGRRTTNYPLGNLVAANGEIVSQAATRISVAFGESSLEPLVNSILEKNPDDVFALVHKAELLIQRGQRRDALKLLKRAAKIDPESDEVDMLSITAMLGVLRDDPDGDPEAIARLDDMIGVDQPVQRSEFLTLQIRAAIARKQWLLAAEKLVDLSKLVSDEPSLSSTTQNVVSNVSLHCELDSWISARFHEVSQHVGDEERKQIDQLLTKSLDGKMLGTDSLLVRFNQHFSHIGINEASDELARRYADRKDLLKLERLSLASTNAQPKEFVDLPTNNLLQLTEGLISGRRGEDALEVLAILDEREIDDNDVDLPELRQLATETIRKPVWQNTVGLDWQKQQLQTRGISTLSQRLSRTANYWGQSLRGWQLMSEGANSVAVRDPYGQVYGVPLDGLAKSDNLDKEAIVSGGVMLVLRPGEIAAIDLYRLKNNQVAEAILWQRNFSGDGVSIAKRRSIMNSFSAPVYWYPITSATASTTAAEFRVGPILSDRIMILQGGDLVAIDLATSATLWRNSNAPRNGNIVAEGARVAVVSPDSEVVQIFNKFDGRALDSKPWVHGKVWHSAGNIVLSELRSDDHKTCIVRMVNPFSGEVLQEIETTTGNRATDEDKRTYGRIVGSRYMVLLSALGKLTVWDIRNGTVLSELETEPFADLQRLHATELDGQIIVLPMRKIDSSRSDPTAILQTRQTDVHQTAHAVYAISTEDGSLRWSTEFGDKAWGCTLAQPSASPVLMLSRAVLRYDSTGTRAAKLDVQALDVRDGTVLHERLGKDIPSRNNEIETRMTIQPVQQRVIVQVSGQILTYNFGEEDTEQPDETDAPEEKPKD